MNNKKEMDLRMLIEMLLRGKKIILLSLVILVGFTYSYIAFLKVPIFNATAEVRLDQVGPVTNIEDLIFNIYSDENKSDFVKNKLILELIVNELKNVDIPARYEALISNNFNDKTFTEFATSDLLLNSVIDGLDYEGDIAGLKNMIRVQNTKGSDTFKIIVKDSSSSLALKISNAISDSLIIHSDIAYVERLASRLQFMDIKSEVENNDIVFNLSNEIESKINHIEKLESQLNEINLKKIVATENQLNSLYLKVAENIIDMKIELIELDERLDSINDTYIYTNENYNSLHVELENIRKKLENYKLEISGEGKGIDRSYELELMKLSQITNVHSERITVQSYGDVTEEIGLLDMKTYTLLSAIMGILIGGFIVCFKEYWNSSKQINN